MPKTTARRSAPAPESLLQRREDGHLVSLSLLTAYRLTTADSVLTPGTQAKTSWIQVALTGDYVSSRYGEFSITKKDLREMAENFTDGVHPVPPTRLCVDYDHFSASPGAPGDGKAAGWFIDLELRADGRELWALIEWTEDGASAVGKKEYQFVSPEFASAFTTPTGDDIGCTLLASAITNRPFLQGMEPISLSAIAAGIATPKASDCKKTLADFSFDEKRTRLGEELERHLGSAQYGGYGEGYWYLVDAYDSFVLYRRGGHLYQLGYAFNTDSGAVTFDDGPVEVVLQPHALELSAQGGSMAANVLKLRDSKGTEVEIDLASLTPAVLDELPHVKDLRAKVPTGEVVALADHQKVVADVVALRGEVKTLADASAKRDAEDDVDTLIAEGKMLPAERDAQIELRQGNPELFKKLAATRTVVSPVATPRAKGSDSTQSAAGDSATQEVQRLAAAAIAADPKLTQQQAEAKVLAADRGLYKRYSDEHSVKV